LLRCACNDGGSIPVHRICFAALAMTCKLDQVGVKVSPCWIHFFDECYFLCPAAGFELFFKGNGFEHGRKMAVEHELVAIVSGSEGVFVVFGFVLDYSVFEFGSDSGVEDFVMSIGGDVGAGLLHKIDFACIYEVAARKNALALFFSSQRLSF